MPEEMSRPAEVTAIPAAASESTCSSIATQTVEQESFDIMDSDLQLINNSSVVPFSDFKI